MRTALKVCGLTRAADVAVCAAAGIEAVGLNFWPKSRRSVDVATARELLREATPGMQRIGVFVERTPAQVATLARELQLDAIQPHGDQPPEGFASTGVPWVWVIRGTPSLHGLRVPSPLPAWVLLDASVPGYGGAGKTTDWSWAAKAVQHLSPLPVWLAGGITPENAAAAVEEVNPAGLDIASGVEAPGIPGHKDAARIDALLRAVQRAT